MRRPNPIRAALALLLALSGAAGTAGAAVVSPFDAGNDGWAVVDYPFRSNAVAPRPTGALAFDALFGNPAGSVRVGDVYAETGISAPAAYLGDREAFYGGSLSYDIYLRYTDGTDYPAVVLSGATMSVYYDAPSPPVGSWERRVVPLVETGWKIGGGNVAVTQADFLDILRTLDAIYVYTEWHTGSDDTSVDNIALAAVGTAVDPPRRTGLTLACAPNPFNPRVTISFTAPRDGRVHLDVHDARGRLVRVLLDADLPRGNHRVDWDGRDDAGRAVASGPYVAKVSSGGVTAAVRVSLVR